MNRACYAFRYSLFALLAFFAALSSPFAYTQEKIQLKGIVWEEEVETIPIRVISNNAKIQDLASHAFNAHGAFTANNDGSPLYILKIDLDDGNRFSWILQRNSPLENIAKGSFKSNRIHHGTYHICDIVIEKTTDLKGFLKGKLAFVGKENGGREIFKSDLFFQHISKLTNDGSYSLSPNWSPDGLKILYTGYFRTGFPDIFLIDVLSKQRSLFASYKGSNTGAVFSPNGEESAMVLSTKKSSEIYLSDNFGRHPTRLTNNNSSELSPSWSPDGKLMAVTSDQLGSPQIYILDKSTGAMNRVNITVSNYCAEPDWNPVDPNWLALTVRINSYFQIAIHNMETGETRMLTNHNGDGVEPTWTSDGRHLVYTVREKGTKRLQLIDSVTGKKTALHTPMFGEASEADFVYPY